MRWTRVPDVIAGHLALLAADAEFMGYLDDNDEALAERMSQDAITVIPGVYWYVLTITAEETTEETIVRYDIFARGTVNAFLLEGRLRTLLHFELPVVVNDVACWSQFRQSIDAHDGVVGQDDIAHRVVEIAISPVRQRART